MGGARSRARAIIIIVKSLDVVVNHEAPSGRDGRREIVAHAAYICTRTRACAVV